MKHRGLLVTLLGLLAGLLGGSAQASVVVETSVDEMTENAALVVRGEVLTTAPRVLGEGRTRIVTDLTLRVDEVMKGALDEPTLTVTLPGGRAGDLAVRVPGTPRFRVGEEVVLFLEATASGFAVVGMQQGKFTVMTEPFTGRKLALRAFDPGLALARRTDEGGLVIGAPDVDSDVRTLDELRARVRAVVTRERPDTAPRLDPER